jgi:hypothetical protein
MESVYSGVHVVTVKDLCVTLTLPGGPNIVQSYVDKALGCRIDPCYGGGITGLIPNQRSLPQSVGIILPQISKENLT